MSPTRSEHPGPRMERRGGRPDLEETILVVDDDRAVSFLLREVLARRGYRVITAESGSRAINALQHHDVFTVITDFQMPDLDGLGLLDQIKRHDPDIPVIVMTGSREKKPVYYLQAGADDFLSKPFDLDAVYLATERAVEKHRLLVENRLYREYIDRVVARRLGEIDQDNIELVRALAEAIELKDPYLVGHAQRVRIMARNLARAIGHDPTNTFESAALLHDIGRILVPGRILDKKEGLTGSEFDQVKQHPLVSERLIKHLPAFESAAPAIRSHHERYDGQGYPDGLAGRDIPLEARILAVADTYDAMTHPRPHRPARDHRQVAAEMVSSGGQHLDPGMVQAFLDSQAFDVAAN
ncbi:MAG: response regulator [Proteobacteria bacterium]|nr:response regulator [Pseudomonadota bacterium]MBU1741196.1 response regulator [Pseudomonadota bacterium]